MTEAMPIRIAVTGAAGRMGMRIIALAAPDSRFHLAAAFERDGSPAIGQDAGIVAGIGSRLDVTVSVPVGGAACGTFDVLIDFSAVEATSIWLDLCRRGRHGLVIGTTGHDSDAMQAIREAAREIPIVKAPNMSVGVNVMLRVARQMAEILDAEYDIELTEAHHRFKVDAPSGTALALRDAVIAGRGAAEPDPVHGRVGVTEPRVVHGRVGSTGRRPSGEIGMHSLRIGDTVGEHTVHFGNLGETLSLTHVAHSRDTFAAGALRAAAWVAGRRPGLYDMQQVLFGE